jgi:hypothetical protein
MTIGMRIPWKPYIDVKVKDQSLVVSLNLKISPTAAIPDDQALRKGISYGAATNALECSRYGNAWAFVLER